MSGPNRHQLAFDSGPIADANRLVDEVAAHAEIATRAARVRRSKDVRAALRAQARARGRITMHAVLTLPIEELEKLQAERPHDAARFARAEEKRQRRARVRRENNQEAKQWST